MSKLVKYLVPIITGIIFVVLIGVGYKMYEYGQDMANGIAAPICVSAVCIAFCLAQMLLINAEKYGWTIAITVLKYVALAIGLLFVFQATLTKFIASAIMCLFGVVMPILLMIGAVALLKYVMVVVVLALLKYSLIAELVLIIVQLSTHKKQINDGLHPF